MRCLVSCERLAASVAKWASHLVTSSILSSTGIALLLLSIIYLATIDSFTSLRSVVWRFSGSLRLFRSQKPLVASFLIELCIVSLYLPSRMTRTPLLETYSSIYSSDKNSFYSVSDHEEDGSMSLIAGTTISSCFSSSTSWTVTYGPIPFGRMAST